MGRSFITAKGIKKSVVMATHGSPVGSHDSRHESTCHGHAPTNRLQHHVTGCLIRKHPSKAFQKDTSKRPSILEQQLFVLLFPCTRSRFETWNTRANRHCRITELAHDGTCGMIRRATNAPIPWFMGPYSLYNYRSRQTLTEVPTHYLVSQK
jgi:hypothetical protein